MISYNLCWGLIFTTEVAMQTKLDYKSDITDEIKLICDKYWARANDKKNDFVYTCREISEEFSLRLSEVSKISKDHSTLIVLDCQCKNCGITKFCHTRSELVQLQDDWMCDECEVTRRKRIRDEEIAEEKLLEQQEIERKRDLISLLRHYRRSQVQSIPSIDYLSKIDLFLLVAVIENIGISNLESPFALRSNAESLLSPSRALDVEILRHLCQKNLLLFNTEEAHHHIEFDDENNLEVDFFHMNFDFAYSKEQLHRLVAESKEEKLRLALVKNPEYQEWGRNIQISECMRYLKKRCLMNGLPTIDNENMESLLGMCLLKYSISKVYYLIWGAVESASSYSNKPNITKRHASNTIYGNIQKRYDDVSDQKLECRKFNRDSRLFQTTVEKTFFDRVYLVKDCGFNYTMDDLARYISEQPLKSHSYTNSMNLYGSYVASLTINLPK